MGILDLLKPDVEKLKDKKDIKGLIRALKNKDEYIQTAAARALGEVKDERAVEPLIRCLDDKSSSVRKEAARALGEIQPERAIKEVVEKPRKSQVAKTSTQARKLINQIIHTVDLRQGSYEMRQEKLERLANSGPNVIPLITEAIESVMYQSHAGHEFSRAGELCTVIGRIGGHSAFDLLIEYFSSETGIWEYESIRAGAAQGLGYLGDSRAVAYLTEVLAEGPRTEEVSSTIKESLKRLGSKPPLTVDTLVEDFVESELVKKIPDFEGFSMSLRQFPKAKRATAWWQLGWALRHKGNEKKAQKCFVKSLTIDASQDSAAWASFRPSIDWNESNVRTLEKLKQKIGVIVDD